VRHHPRPSNLAAWVVGTLFLLFVASFIDAGRLADKRANEQTVRSALAEKLQLTDLALFTEARYTRPKTASP